MTVRYGSVKLLKTAKIGTIMPWAGDGNEGLDVANLPSGWIVCNGSLHNASKYPLLASIIGDSYGGTNFAGVFPNYEGTFRVPNMTLKMPMDIEAFHLDNPKYQYGYTQTRNLLANNTNPLVGGYGELYPIQTTISTDVDIDFTVDASLVMKGKFTNVSIGDPSFNTTIYTIGRKLGINHTPGHSHGGSYTKATQQFTSPMVFEPDLISVGGVVAGRCQSSAYDTCELKRPSTAPTWQGGAISMTSYGDAQHEFTLPTTDRFYNFIGSEYWQNVPADSWPPPGSHPSGEVTVSDLSYQFSGSRWTSGFNVPTPVKTHQQPAWTGVFPKAQTYANSRNHFGPIAYLPDNSSAWTIPGVTIAAGAPNITLPAGADIGAEFDKIVPYMWVYTDPAITGLTGGTQILSITRISGTSTSNYVYKLDLSAATRNLTTLTNVTLNFKHGTYPTTLNNQTGALDPNGTQFAAHNHGSFDLIMGVGSLATPATFPVNDVSLGSIAPENINDALNIIADVSMPALVVTFMIKAY